MDDFIGIDWSIIRLEIVEQIDKVRIVQLDPVGNSRRRAATVLGQLGDDALSQLRIGNFPNAHQDQILTEAS